MTAPTFLQKLQNEVSDFRLYWRQIELWVGEGDFNTLRHIVRTMLDGAKTPLQKSNCSVILWRLVSELAWTNGWENVAFLFEIHALLEFVDFEMDRDLRQSQRPITLSSRLAMEQEETTLHQAFEHFGNDKRYYLLLTLLAQEMALRQKKVIDTPVERFWRDQVVAQKHPLQWLPLHLVSMEQNLSEYLPRRNVPGLSCAAPPPEPDPIQSGVKEESHLKVAPRPADKERFVNLLQKPENGGNREFGLARYFVENLNAPTDFSAADLLRLEFEWLEGAQASKIILREVIPTQAFEFLFSAASTSGCYGVDAGGAWGRLRAWKALGELVEVPENATLEEIAAQASRFTWYSFISDVGFVGLGPDFGLVAIAPDAKELVVLASTDCD